MPFDAKQGRYVHPRADAGSRCYCGRPAVAKVSNSEAQRLRRDHPRAFGNEPQPKPSAFPSSRYVGGMQPA